MKKLKMRLKTVLAVCFIVGLVGCATDAQIAQETAKYTNEIAQAVAAAGWKVAGAIVGGLVLYAILSS